MEPFAARIALLFALLAATMGAYGGPDLDHLLDRMRSAAGPTWNAHFVSVSRLNVEGTVSVVESDGQGLRFDVRRCTGELCDGTYFDGVRLYSVNINGTAVPATGEPQPYLRALRWIASLGFLAPDFASAGRRVDDGGTVTFEGKRYRSLFVVDPEAVAMQLYVDPQSALLRYARDVNGTDLFEYRDYRKVEAFNVPFEILHNGSQLERYDDRTPVAPAFEPPHGPRPTFSGPPGPVPTDPLHITPIFDCQLGGIKVRCLLDTGNSGLAMSSEFASEIGAPVAGVFTVRGLGGYSTQVVRAGELRIGNAVFPPAYYVVLNDIRTYGYDVVVGADALGSTTLAVDIAKHTVEFGAKASGGGVAVPLEFENFVPVTNIGLGTLDARLAVDTGDESNINLSGEFYAKHPDLFVVTSRREVSGVGGKSLELLGQIPQVQIGGYHIGPQTIGATQTLLGTASGHIGAGFLEQFRVVLDYANGLLHLEPKAPAAT